MGGKAEQGGMHGTGGGNVAEGIVSGVQQAHNQQHCGRAEQILPARQTHRNPTADQGVTERTAVCVGTAQENGDLVGRERFFRLGIREHGGDPVGHVFRFGISVFVFRIGCVFHDNDLCGNVA